MKLLKIFFSISLLVVFMSSCQEDFLDTAPTDQLTADVMFESLEGANLALNGMYRYMYAFDPVYGNHDAFGHMATVLEMDLLGEDMLPFSSGHGWFIATYQWRTHRNSDAGMTHLRWLNYYAVVNNANLILSVINDIEGPQAELDHIAAQAFSARAFAYYQLLQMYAPAYHRDPAAPGVPLYVEPTEEGQPRASIQQGYDLIYSDLNTAIELWDGSTRQIHRSHINLPVAHGLLARAALARQDWETAATNAQMAIELSGRSLFAPGDYPPAFQVPQNVQTVAQLEAYIAGFPRNNLFNNVNASEWMWGMQINEEHATIFASFFSHIDPTTFGYAQLGLQKLISHGEEGLYHQISDTDVRKRLWVAPGAGNRYPDGNPTPTYMRDYVTVKFLTQVLGSWPADYVFMRLAEMYLIQAEALARGAGSDADAAQALYDLVSQRDSQYTLTTNTGDDLIEEIMFHRRVELWGEGFRFIDLKRTGQPMDRTGKGHDPSLAVEMLVPGDSDLFNWLIPRDEIDANDQISAADQNP